MSLSGTQPRSTLSGELSGGFASAVVSITGNIAAGVIAFSPLGPDFVGQGILAGMFASIVAGLLASLTGSAAGMITGPKATTAMAFAALLSQLLATGRFDLTSPEQAQQIVALAFSAVLLSGSVQILLGAFRVGALVKFMPYPVVAGIRNTTAILLIWGQIWPFLGVSRQSLLSLLANPAQIQPATAAVATLTALIAWKGGKVLPKPSVPVAALLAGTGLHYVLHTFIEGLGVGPVLGTIPSAVPSTEWVGAVAGVFMSPETLSLLPFLISGALAIAVLDSISALITLVSYESLADRRCDANRQLVGQGIGTAVGALFGALSTSGILARAAVNHRAGGRTRLSGALNALGVLALIAVLTGPLGMVPKSAIAGLIMVIAAGLIDGWSLGLVGEVIRGRGKERQNLYANVAEMVFVVAVGVAVNLVAAVGAGVALSVIVFVARMSRSPVRRIRTGSSVRSTRHRDEHLTDLLDEHGDRIAIIELEGTVFFGSCDALATRVEELAADGAEFILLDMKRVGAVDATGYKVLGQSFQRLRKAGTTLAFGHVAPDDADGDIFENLVLAGIPDARLFDTTDQALEYFEEGLLLKLSAEDTHSGGWSVEDFGQALGLSDGEQGAFAGHLNERKYTAGEYVFHRGDTGRSMYFLSRGSADVTIPVPNEGRDRRLATFARGTLFGEMALLDGLPRAASVQAVEPLVCFELTHEKFERLRADQPPIAMKIQGTIGRILGSRLRAANSLILELDS
jgi:MFS superfamily sulfate permease-like transporter